ncbi:MAG TPA: SRPBCC domain-containing protein [Candidatus Dormibacteraeota bacterium]|nr:SRPBCC domain-containing protein [Candidatus Dormibacteraeota bacterium]
MTKTENQTVVRLQRTIPATPDKVYRAWLDPELVPHWMAPGDFLTTRVEVDERVGGHYRIWQENPGGERGGYEAEIVELVPNERIVFNWTFVGPDRMAGPHFDSKLTITLDEGPHDSTTLTLIHERLEGLAAAMPYVAENIRPGWDDVLDNLVALVV